MLCKEHLFGKNLINKNRVIENKFIKIIKMAKIKCTLRSSAFNFYLLHYRVAAYKSFQVCDNFNCERINK